MRSVLARPRIRCQPSAPQVATSPVRKPSRPPSSRRRSPPALRDSRRTSWRLNLEFPGLLVVGRVRRHVGHDPGSHPRQRGPDLPRPSFAVGPGTDRDECFGHPVAFHPAGVRVVFRAPRRRPPATRRCRRRAGGRRATRPPPPARRPAATRSSDAEVQAAARSGVRRRSRPDGVHQAGADSQCTQHAEDQPVDVKEREAVHQGVRCRPGPRLRQGVEVRGDCSGGQDDALGRAGGCAGVHHQRARPGRRGAARRGAGVVDVRDRHTRPSARPRRFAEHASAPESASTWSRSNGPASAASAPTDTCGQGAQDRDHRGHLGVCLNDHGPGSGQSVRTHPRRRDQLLAGRRHVPDPHGRAVVAAGEQPGSSSSSVFIARLSWLACASAPRPSRVTHSRVEHSSRRER